MSDTPYLGHGGAWRRIKELEREVAELREALEKISNMNYHRGHGPHCTCSQEDREEIARAVLKGKP